MGFTAVKALIDTVLLSWSAIQRAATANARKKDALQAQVIRQGFSAGSGVLSLAASGLMPIAAQEISGVRTLNPVEQISNGLADGPKAMLGGSANLSDKLSSGRFEEAGLALAGKAVKPGAKGLGKIVTGSSAAAANILEDGAATSNREVLQDANARHHGRAGRQGPGLLGASRAQQEQGPAAVEPAWMQAARKDEADAKDTTLDALIASHSGKLGRLHQRTQALMLDNSKAKAPTRTMAKGLVGVGTAQQAQDAELAADATEGVDELGGPLLAALAEAADVAVLKQDASSAVPAAT